MMKSGSPSMLCRLRFHSLTLGTTILIVSFSHTVSPWIAEGDEALPIGNPPVVEHTTPNGVIEIAQRLIQSPFSPPDVKLKDKEALSSLNDWFTKQDKNKIDQLASLDFYASSGPQSVGVVP